VLNKPVIALDIDDVLINSADLLMEDYNRRFGTSLTRADYYSKDISKFGVSHYDLAADRFREFQESKAFTDAEAIQEAIESVFKLAPYYEFVGVTSRPEFIKSQTNKWIGKRFGTNISRIIHTSFVMGRSDHVGTVLTKADVCEKINASYLIEDHLHHAVPVAENGTRVFLIDQIWNQSDDLPATITRVHSWTEIERLLLADRL
jgi:uncharacterized HAD superfamily protein